jgi:hypothetical protein
MPPTRQKDAQATARRPAEDDGMFGEGNHFTSSSIDMIRYMSSLQVFTIPESQHEVSRQPRMLSQDVRVVR